MGGKGKGWDGTGGVGRGGKGKGEKGRIGEGRERKVPEVTPSKNPRSATGMTFG